MPKQKERENTSPVIELALDLDDGVEVDKLVADYGARGLIELPALLEPQAVAEIRCRIEQYSRDVLPSLQVDEYVLERDGTTVRNLWNMQRHDLFFAALG